MGHNLLLADDSITIQKVVKIIFSAESYALTIVDNGDDALLRAREAVPDVMLIDAVMPGKNGYEVCREAKNDPALSAVPILLLTGVFEPFDEAKARDSGADDFIAKPFESQVLIDKVAQLIALGNSRKPAPPPAPVESLPIPERLPEPVPDFFSEPVYDPDPVPVYEPYLEPVYKTSPEPVYEAYPEPVYEPLPEPVPVVTEKVSYRLDELPVAPAVVAVGHSPLRRATTVDEERLVIEEVTSLDDLWGVSAVKVEEEHREPLKATVEDFSFEEDSDGVAALAQVQEPSWAPAQHADLLEPAPEQRPGSADLSPVAQPVVATVASSPMAAPLSEEQLVAALSNISREIIERIVREVVPDLAEKLIREEIRKIRDGI